jgi:hypothetical protein
MSRITHVLDACAAACYLKGDCGSEALAALLGDVRSRVVIHEATLVGLSACFERVDGKDIASQAWDRCEEVMQVETPATTNFGKRVARWLAFEDITMDEAYAGATAEEYGAILVVYAGGALLTAAQSIGVEVLVLSPKDAATALPTPAALPPAAQAAAARRSEVAPVAPAAPIMKPKSKDGQVVEPFDLGL